MVKERTFSLKTKGGCRRLFFLLVSIILLSSFIAAIFSTDGFKVKVQHIFVDVRGGVINGELYYPGNTSSKDKLPGIVITHGGGSTYGLWRGTSEELARRGFVVFNVSAYGSGLSEQPPYDEAGKGAGTGTAAFSMSSPLDLLDSVNYVRGLAFVDPTRVGLAGHSVGTIRTCTVATMDCGFLNYNDIMINVLSDTFGQKFTKDEINTDAAVLAKQRLTPDQLTYYNYLAKEKREYFDTRIKSVLGISSVFGQKLAVVSTVKVAGIDVKRTCQTNYGFTVGAYDSSCYGFYKNASAKGAYYTGKDNVKWDTWYVANDVAASSKQIGDVNDTSIPKSKDFLAALNSRTVRMMQITKESHAEQFISSATNKNVCNYFTATLSYNRGNLTDASTVPMASTDQIWFWRTVCNAIAMLAMLALMFPLVMWLTKYGFFAPAVAAPVETKVKTGKLSYWITGVITVIIGFGVIYWCIYENMSKFFGMALPTNRFWSLFSSGWASFRLLTYMAIPCVVILVIKAIISKKRYGETGLKSLNIGLKFTTILKTLLLGAIFIAVGYLLLSTIEYLFNQDFEFWQTQFGEMRVAYWGIVPRYFISYLPACLLLGMAINYVPRKDIPQWKDTLYTVIFNSLGIWICCLIETIYTHSVTPGNDYTEFACFITYYYAVFLVPITVYIHRKLYKLTNSVWAGAIIVALITSWAMVAGTGINGAYVGSTFGQVFFGF